MGTTRTTNKPKPKPKKDGTATKKVVKKTKK
jgi:hypothetical protein